MALVDPRLAERAARPGRVLDTAVRLVDAVAADPDHGATLLRVGLRDARWLHSAERRLVGDGVRDLLRWSGVLTGTTAERWLRWVAWRSVGDEALDAEIAHLAAAVDPASVARLAGVGPEVAAELLRALGSEVGSFVLASNGRAPVALRASPRIGRDALADRLGQHGIPTRPGGPPGCLIITGERRFALEDLREFRSGEFEVQDEGSQAVAAYAAEGIDGEILDLCAGAGGKSLALAAAGHRVVAADVRRSALAELERRARRAGLRIPLHLSMVGAPLPEDWRGRFPLVLVDAPCTGTGVWRRHPELRPRAAHFPELAATQSALLDLAAGVIADRGRLAYATCSVLPAENEDVLARFLERHPTFSQGRGVRRWLPHRDGTDGFTVTEALAPVDTPRPRV